MQSGKPAEGHPPPITLTDSILNRMKADAEQLQRAEVERLEKIRAENLVLHAKESERARRDSFAMAALSGMTQRMGLADLEGFQERIVKLCWSFADEMLKADQK